MGPWCEDAQRTKVFRPSKAVTRRHFTLPLEIWIFIGDTRFVRIRHPGHVDCDRLHVRLYSLSMNEWSPTIHSAQVL
eukprot:7069941-Pyramimonas_sp.AAC.1